MIYLDYAATSPLRKEVLAEMMPYLTDAFGNSDSLHAFGRRAAQALRTARDTVAETLGVQPSEVCFTSGGTASASPRSSTTPCWRRRACCPSP